MKNILIILLFIFSLSTYANNWETIKYKDIFSFKLPPGYRDTTILADSSMSVRYYFSQQENIVYSCSIIEDSKPGYINSVEKIDSNYSKFFTGYISKFPKAEGIIKNFIDYKGLRALKAQYTVSLQGKELVFKLLSVNVKKTTVSFITNELQSDNNSMRFDTLINSVTFNKELSKKDQMNSLTSVISAIDPYTLGYMVGKIFPFLLIAIIGIVFILKRK